MKEQLRKYFDKYVDLNDDEIDHFFSKLTVNQYKKNEFLLLENQLCRSNYFIIDGVVRVFYTDEKGIEKITQFAIENWWVTSMESFIKKTPSFVAIQALENTTTLEIHKSNLEDLYQSIPKLERAFRIIAENMLIAWQRKNGIYLQRKSKERYEHLLKLFPDFFQRVPQYMIASYLEMTPEYLSGLRKKQL